MKRKKTMNLLLLVTAGFPAPEISRWITDNGRTTVERKKNRLWTELNEQDRGPIPVKQQALQVVTSNFESYESAIVFRLFAMRYKAICETGIAHYFQNGDQLKILVPIHINSPCRHRALNTIQGLYRSNAQPIWVNPLSNAICWWIANGAQKPKHRIDNGLCGPDCEVGEFWPKQSGIHAKSRHGTKTHAGHSISILKLEGCKENTPKWQ